MNKGTKARAWAGALACLLALISIGDVRAQVLIAPSVPISEARPNAAQLREEDQFLRVRRSGSLESALTVLAHSIPAAATADDFRAFQNVSVLFPAGEAEADIDVGIRDDLEIESDENFFVRFTDHAGQVISDVEVWIASNDTTEPTHNPLLPEAVCFQQDGGDTIAAVAEFIANEKFHVVWNDTETGQQYVQRHLIDGRVDRNFIRFGAFRLRALPLSNGDTFVERQQTPDSPVELLRLTVNGAAYPNFEPVRDLGEILQLSIGENGTFYVLRRRQEDEGATLIRLWGLGRTDPTFTSPAVTSIKFFSLGSAVFIVDGGNVMRRLNADGSIDPTYAQSREVFQIKPHLSSLFIESRDSASDPRVIMRLFPDGSEVWSFHTMPASTYTGWGLPARDSAGRFYNLEAIEPRGYRLRRYDTIGLPDPTYAQGTFVDIDPGAKFIGMVGEYLYVTGLRSANGVTPACAAGALGLARIPVRQAQPQIVVPLIAKDPAGVEAQLDNVILESAGTVNLPLWRTGPNSEPLRVRYQARNGSAGSGEDFVFASGDISFAAGITRASAPITAINDQRIERDEIFFLDFFNADTGVALSSVQVIVRNDDLGLAIHHATTLEDGRLRIRYLHDLATPQVVRSSADLINWSDYPSYQIDGQQFIEVDPSHGTRFFATPAYPEREMAFP